ncbi:MAG: hypothetical protein V3T23_12420 [Nitrososphaerales archaeon]
MNYIEPGMKLYFFQNGEPVDVYFDAEATVPLPRPVIASAEGEFQDIYFYHTDNITYELYSDGGRLVAPLHPPGRKQHDHRLDRP